MALFTITAWDKSHPYPARPIWEASVTAGNVEEAYRIGKSQFESEQPTIKLEDVKIEAVGLSPENS